MLLGGLLLDHRPPDHRRPPRPERLGRERHCLGIDHGQAHVVTVGAGDQVRKDLAREMRRCDAIARVAGGIVDARVADAAERRQVGRRNIDGAAPGVLDRDAGEARKHQAKALCGLRDRPRVVREHIVHRSSRPASAAAERDPAVACGAEVAQRRAEIGDQLAAGPADLLELFRRGSGHHDVAAPRHELATQLRPADTPGVDREHGMRCVDPSPQRHRRGAVEPSHTRSFVDDDATLEDDPPESAREPRRLHGGAVSHEGARAKCGRSAPRLDLSGAQLVELLRRTHLAREGDHLVACTLICFNSDRVHVAAAPVPGVDAVALAELSDRIDAGCDRPACFDRAFHAVKRHEAMELVPPPARESPVASARTAAADVLLEDGDAEVGVALVQEIRGPQTCESAAHDDDVCLDVLVERWALGPRVLRKRVAQPPAPLVARREGEPGQVEAVGARPHGASLAP